MCKPERDSWSYFSIMSKVFVLNANKEPLDPIEPGWARKLLKAGKAAVFRRFPFTLILKQELAEPRNVQPLRLKLDPGSRTTDIAVVNDATGEVVFGAELEHRGQLIVKRWLDRRAIRHNRRNRKTRYRQPRFLNRRRPAGWLPPSLESRIANVVTWVKRLARWCPVGAISMELVKFDTQLMQNAEISGVEYQQGELVGYEIRQYLLEKWGRTCAYCGKTGMPLQIEHLIPRTRGGSNRVSNLTLACESCNQKKGSHTAVEFGYPQLEKQAKAPLRDAGAVNATRWKLYHQLEELGLPIETGSGGLTKYNRTIRHLAKTHWLDAACVGESTPAILQQVNKMKVLQIEASGHGNRQMCRTDKYGFPIRYRSRQKVQFGFRTGDVVKAKVGKGKYTGVHIGRVTVRATGRFVVKKGHKPACETAWGNLSTLHRNDGYVYSFDNKFKERKGEAASSVS
jgi:5-methylcytosine-specific restriction endonuclease McrA